MDAVCAHFGIRSMSERQALVFYGTSSMLLGMCARWLSSDRAMPLENLLATARTAVLRGPAKAMLAVRLAAIRARGHYDAMLRFWQKGF